MDRNGTLTLPVGESLRQQREGRNKEHDEPIISLHFFGDFHGGKGLPCSTGHDQLATIIRLKAIKHTLNGFFLIFPRSSFLLLNDFSCLQVDRPVDLRGCEHRTTDQLNWRRNVLHLSQGILRPVFIRRDDVALLEVVAVRGRNERINARLWDHSILVVKLTLDGCEGFRIVFEGRDEINADIFAALL